MNLLVLSNMKPTEATPTFGMFVGNQVEALRQTGALKQLLFLGVTVSKKGKFTVLTKYLNLMLALFTQAIFSRTRYDVVHVHYFFPTIVFALVYKLLRNWRCKIVVTFHGSDVQLHSKPSWLYRFTSRFVDHHVFVSRGLANDYFYQVPEDKLSILSAGILDLYNLEGKGGDKQYDLAIVGALSKLKGLDRLMALLDEIKQPLKIAVIGAGPVQQALQQYQSDLHQVNLLGTRLAPEVKQVMQQSRYLISLSRHESFGLVMTEAMACGTPVIATKTNGAAAQIQPAQNGFLLENIEDLDSFVKENADKLVGYFTDTTLAQYEQLSIKSAEYATEHRMSQVIKSLLAIYRKI